MVVTEALVNSVNLLVWGSSEPSEENFRRWCQGFQFSENESTALVQSDNGPCAIIAAVQAGILRQMIFQSEHSFPVSTSACNSDLLINALLEIFITVTATHRCKRFSVFQWDIPENQTQLSEALATMSSGLQYFSSGLSLNTVDIVEDLHAVLLSLTPTFQNQFGILCFLYSVLVTHGLEDVKIEMEDETEALIDSNFGNASQCLLNLLLTGQSSPHLFDGVRDISGFCMHGVTRQPKTGFLTVMEALRYTEVGWYLKNPSTPIWVIGSESHFTVFASPYRALVEDEDAHPSMDPSSLPTSKIPLLQAEREFENLCDDRDAGFLSLEKFDHLLARLGLPRDSESIQQAKSSIDPDEMGIILRKPFFDYYYAEELKKRVGTASEFPVLHFNGLPVSNSGGRVFMSIDGHDKFVNCFEVKDVHLPTGYYLGVSAATGDLTDTHDVLSLKTYDLGLVYTPEELLEDRSHIEPSADSAEAPRAHVPDVPRTSIWSIIFYIFLAIFFFCLCVLGYIYYVNAQRRKKRLF